MISQTSYQFGASGNTNQVQFSIPNNPGVTIQICGRSANVYDVERPYELSTITRWQIDGAGINIIDSDVPPMPAFGVSVLPEGGGIEIGGLGFETLENTRTITLGTINSLLLRRKFCDGSAHRSSWRSGSGSDGLHASRSHPNRPSRSLPQYLADWAGDRND